MKIKRSDPIYLEIENFKKYELTNNIAFEMAIRNEEVMKKMSDDIENDMISDIEQDGFVYPFVGLYEQKHLMLSDNHRLKLKQFSEDREHEKSSLGDNTSDIVTEHVRFYSGMDIDFIYEVKIKDDIADSQLEPLLEEYFVNVITPNEFRLKVNEANPDDNIDLVFFAKHHPDFFDVIQLDIDESYLIGSRIDVQLIMSRPLMKLKEVAKNVNVSFNMVLSADELIAQLLIIKQEFDKHFHEIKSQEELLGARLEKVEKEICNNNGKYINAKETLLKTAKIADMFFIYDSLKAGINNTIIKHEVYEYHKKQGKEKPLSEKTLYKYRDIAINYIDKYGYKELLAGVKMPEEFFS